MDQTGKVVSPILLLVESFQKQRKWVQDELGLPEQNLYQCPKPPHWKQMSKGLGPVLRLRKKFDGILVAKNESQNLIFFCLLFSYLF